MPDQERQELKLRLWEDQDRTEILKLMEVVFGKGRLTSTEFFDWQYIRNPAGRAIMVCCEASDGSLAASYTVIPVPIRIDGKPLLGTLSLNTATHPRFQRRGLFVKTAETLYAHLSQKGIALTIGFPNHLSYPGFVTRLGFTDLGRTVTLRHILDSRTFLRRWAKRKSLRPLCAAGGLLINVLQRLPKPKMPVCRLQTFQGLSVESLWENARMIVAAEADWLNWRYVDHPFIRYEIALVGDLKQPLGLMVYKIDEVAEGNRGLIMELLLCRDAEEAVLEALLAHAFEHFMARQCVSVSAYATAGSRKSIFLRKTGFWALPKRFETAAPLIYRRHLPHVPLLALTDIDFSPGILDTA
jgi:hypothetical protein